MMQRRALLASALPALVFASSTTATRSGAQSSVEGGVPSPAVIRRFAAPRPADELEHAVVYRREDEFCAWTYTRGFWEDADGHFMQNFDSLTVNYQGTDEQGITHDNIFETSTGRRTLTIRSADRGRTWTGDNPEVNLLSQGSETGGDARTPFAESGPIDYLDKNVFLYSFSPGFGTPNGAAPLQVSKDAGRTWSAPSDVPLDGLHSLTALNSFLVRPDGRCLLFMFEVSADGWNRRPLVYGSLDGGTEFHFMTFITPEADPLANAKGDWQSSFAYGGHRWFYPRAIMLPNGRILCILRCQRSPQGDMWSEVYKSDDGGRTWGFLSRVNDFGAPGSIVRMSDGRIVVVYGYRLANYGVRAAVSEDEGATWGNELIIRDDGGSWDLGYPNAWEVEPGKVGCIYYFNSKDDPVQVTGGKRHIARSIFTI